jgi:hypothetical protein
MLFKARKQNLLHSSPLATEQTRTASRGAAGDGKTDAGHRPWFHRAVGFWVGGIVLGTAGCIVGAAFPYQHPVAVTASILWWGIYIGTFGASVGALIGVLVESSAAARSRNSDARAGSGPLQPAGAGGTPENQSGGEAPEPLRDRFG